MTKECFSLDSIFAIFHLFVPLFAKCLSLFRPVSPSQLGDGGMKGLWDVDGGCTLPEEPLLPALCHRSTVSQPAMHWPHPSPSHYFCLLLSRSASTPEAIAVPMSPSYANCLLATNGACLSGNLSACLSAALPVCLSDIPAVLLSVCTRVCLSICLSSCQPLFLSNIPLPESCQAVSRSANLPVYLSSVCISICLSACLCACLPVCSSICLLACLPVVARCEMGSVNL